MDIEETGVEFWTGLVLIRLGPVGWVQWVGVMNIVMNPVK